MTKYIASAWKVPQRPRIERAQTSATPAAKAMSTGW
jgi:hypothetical protein